MAADATGAASAGQGGAEGAPDLVGGQIRGCA